MPEEINLSGLPQWALRDFHRTQRALAVALEGLDDVEHCDGSDLTFRKIARRTIRQIKEMGDE